MESIVRQNLDRVGFCAFIVVLRMTLVFSLSLFLFSYEN